MLYLLLLLPLSSPLTCYSCYSLLTNSSEIASFLPPLLPSNAPCHPAHTTVCGPAQTCLYTHLLLTYGEATAELTTMGCAGVEELLTCTQLQDAFYHPYFDLDLCQLDRCSMDKCNHGDTEMLSGGTRHLASYLVTMVTWLVVVAWT